MLLFFIAKDHCFVDGNKRTAFNVCEIFLASNGYLLKDNYNYAQYVEELASIKTHQIPIERILHKIEMYLKNHCYFDEDYN